MSVSSKALRLVLPLLILAAAAGGFMTLRATRPTPAPLQVEERTWRVEATTVTPGAHSPHVMLYGTVEAPRRAGLSAAVASDVRQVPVVEGQQVEAGRILVILDDRDIKLALRQREADMAEIEALIASERRRHEYDLVALERERAMLALDRKAVARAEDLNRRQMGSESLLDEARLALERQQLSLSNRQREVNDHQARLAQLEARLARAQALRDQALLDRERSRITAPFTGRVIRVAVAPGDRVRIGDTLLELYAIDDLEIRAQIPYRHLPTVRTALDNGQRLLAKPIGDSSPLRARLDRLAGEAVQDAGGVDALLPIIEGAAAVVPGRLIPLLLKLPPQERTVELPFDALYGLDRIYRLEEERMVALKVERVGERRLADGTSRVLVRSPHLQAGDRIVTTQLPNAVSGLKVAVIP